MSGHELFLVEQRLQKEHNDRWQHIWSDPYARNGWIDIYAWKHNLNIRLHHLGHLDGVLHQHATAHNQVPKFQPISYWNEIWESCGHLVDVHWQRKHHGRVRRGIRFTWWGGIVAYIESNGVIYKITGCW